MVSLSVPLCRLQGNTFLKEKLLRITTVEDKIEMKREIVIIGLLLILIGVIEFLIEYYQVSTLMNVTDVALLIVGVFLFFVGVSSSEVTKSDYDAKGVTPELEIGQKQVPRSSASKSVNCPKCGRQIPSDAHLCPYCGFDVLECR
jgi:Uncharacterised protein family UPF0547